MDVRYQVGPTSLLRLPSRVKVSRNTHPTYPTPGPTWAEGPVEEGDGVRQRPRDRSDVHDEGSREESVGDTRVETEIYGLRRLDSVSQCNSQDLGLVILDIVDSFKKTVLAHEYYSRVMWTSTGDRQYLLMNLRRRQRPRDFPFILFSLFPIFLLSSLLSLLVSSF